MKLAVPAACPPAFCCMKKIFTVLLYVVLAILAAAPACAAVLDSCVDPDYDFAEMKRIYIRPAERENFPENARFSLTNLIEEWTRGILADRKRMKFTPFVKSTERMWKDIQFIKGPQDFSDPFESEEAAAKFYSLLGEACEGALKISVSVTQDRRWQEPRTEVYWVHEKVVKVKNRKGELEEVYEDVMKEEYIPGRWLVDTRVECWTDLYDVRDGGEKLAAAARSEALDSRDEEKSAQAAEVTVKTALRAALGSIFYK